MKNTPKKRTPIKSGLGVIKNPAQRKKSSQATLTVLLVSVAAILLAVVLSISFIKFYKPSVDTDVPFGTGTATPPDESTAPQGPGDETTNSSSSSEKPPEVPIYKRDTEVVNFLVVGQDVNSWNTDVVMLVNFNMREGGLSVMQFPRDTYIEYGNSRGRINTTMVKFYNEAKKASPKKKQAELISEAMTDMCELLETTLCIQIDGFVHVNLQGFRGIVNALGGVYIDVPCDMFYEDPEQDLYIDIKAGPQRLTGEQAEGFVRFRSGFVQADIGRVDAQKIFLTALFKQVKTSLTVKTIPKVAEQLVKHVITDVPIADIVIYAKELLGVDMGNVSMMTLHGSAAQVASGAWYYVMNRASTLSMINEYFNVYDRDITDAIFDPTMAFTDETYAKFNRVYIADPDDAVVTVRPDVSTGTEINNGELTIPTIK